MSPELFWLCGLWSVILPALIFWSVQRNRVLLEERRRCHEGWVRDNLAVLSQYARLLAEWRDDQEWAEQYLSTTVLTQEELTRAEG